MSEYLSGVGTSDAESITVLGQDLAGQLMGRVSFGELAFWLVAMERPTPGQLRVFEAVLVALADHGFTPSAIAARLTLTGAPESIQGAVAAGLLGGGSRFLGVTEDTGRFLAEALAGAGAGDGGLPADQAGWDCVAESAVRARDSGSADGGVAADRRVGRAARPAPAAVRGRRPGAPGRARTEAAAERGRGVRRGPGRSGLRA